jgi:ribosomal protein S18 acetylase RimI-like enzyme
MAKPEYCIRVARPADDPLVVALSKLDRFTRDLTAVYARADLDTFYENRSVLLGYVRNPRSITAVGFLYGRHLVRRPYSSLYYMGVDPEARSHGVGRAMVSLFLSHSPHGCIQLVCDEPNPANEFYARVGFQRIGEGASKKGVPFIRWELRS